MQDIYDMNFLVHVFISRKLQLSLEYYSCQSCVQSPITSNHTDTRHVSWPTYRPYKPMIMLQFYLFVTTVVYTICTVAISYWVLSVEVLSNRVLSCTCSLLLWVCCGAVLHWSHDCHVGSKMSPDMIHHRRHWIVYRM